MRISRPLYDEMVAHAREEAPNECCGVVGSRDGEARAVYRAVNAEASPLRFSIEPREQIQLERKVEEDGLEIGAIYHSHTRTAPKPSQTDVTFGEWWPGVLWVIVGLVNDAEPEVRTWLINESGQVSEADLVVG